MLGPIPLEVLIDTVEHEVLVESNRGDTFQTPSTLTNVLVQDKMSRTVVDGNLIITSDALMFWDVFHSTDASFKVGDRITFNSVQKYIKNVFYAKTRDGVHHVELMLL